MVEIGRNPGVRMPLTSFCHCAGLDAVTKHKMESRKVPSAKKLNRIYLEAYYERLRLLSPEHPALAG